jgi:hypothetical protein
MTHLSREPEVVVNIAKTLAAWWYDPDMPFNHQREAYDLVCRITRELLGHKEETYERAILERDATVLLCQHYHVGEDRA